MINIYLRIRKYLHISDLLHYKSLKKLNKLSIAYLLQVDTQQIF